MVVSNIETEPRKAVRYCPANLFANGAIYLSIPLGAIKYLFRACCLFSTVS